MSEIEKETTAVKSAVFGSQAYLMILLAETGNHRDFTRSTLASTFAIMTVYSFSSPSEIRVA
jgi:hypothetical protein